MSMPELTGHGIALPLPRGYEGRIYRRAEETAPEAAARARGTTPSAAALAAPAPTYPVLHAGNFPLPPGMGDFGSGAVEVMTTGDVLVVLFEYDAASVGTPLFAVGGIPTLRPTDFRPDTLQRPINGQVGVQRFFNEAGRAFCLYVVLGGGADRAYLVSVVNQALGALVIDPAPTGGG
ncbi:MAG: hypothetical protein ACXW1S_02555 [Acidimicrobiia bacterium]